MRPRPALVDGDAAVRVAGRILQQSLVLREVIHRQEAAMPAASRIRHIGALRELDELLGDRALIEVVDRCLDRLLSAQLPTPDLSISNTAKRLGPHGLTHDRSDLGHAAVRHVDVGRSGPVGAEALSAGRDSLAQVLVHREAAARQLDRRLEDVDQSQPPEVHQRGRERAERARHHRREQAVARDQVDAFSPKPVDRHRAWRVALAADRDDRLAVPAALPARSGSGSRRRCRWTAASAPRARSRPRRLRRWRCRPSGTS